MKQKGIILVSVLIFLFLLSLLALHSLSNSQLQTKISNNLLTQAQELQALEAGLNQGEQLLLTNPKSNCIITDPTQNKPYCTTKLANWTIYYQDELLTTDICLIKGYTKDQEAILTQGNIYRITSWSSNNGSLQTTYAVATANKCEEMTNKIWTGRLSWKEKTGK